MKKFLLSGFLLFVALFLATPAIPVNSTAVYTVTMASVVASSAQNHQVNYDRSTDSYHLVPVDLVAVDTVMVCKECGRRDTMRLYYSAFLNTWYKMEDGSNDILKNIYDINHYLCKDCFYRPLIFFGVSLLVIAGLFGLALIIMVIWEKHHLTERVGYLWDELMDRLDGIKERLDEHPSK